MNKERFDKVCDQFVPGDRVKCIKAHDGRLPTGTGTVIESDYSDQVLVRFDKWNKGHGPGDREWYFGKKLAHERLEHVVEPVKKAKPAKPQKCTPKREIDWESFSATARVVGKYNSHAPSYNELIISMLESSDSLSDPGDMCGTYGYVVFMLPDRAVRAAIDPEVLFPG